MTGGGSGMGDVRRSQWTTRNTSIKSCDAQDPVPILVTGQDHWRMVNAPHPVALVRAGATFVNGKLVERPEDKAAEAASQKPPYLHPPVTASVRFGGFQGHDCPGPGMPELAPCPW
jgi:hypothetical protein